MKDTIPPFMDPFILWLWSRFLHERHYFQLISHFLGGSQGSNWLSSLYFFPTPSEFLKIATADVCRSGTAAGAATTVVVISAHRCVLVYALHLAPLACRPFFFFFPSPSSSAGNVNLDLVVCPLHAASPPFAPFSKQSGAVEKGGG